jgi:hypothetical protein
MRARLDSSGGRAVRQLPMLLKYEDVAAQLLGCEHYCSRHMAEHAGRLGFTRSFFRNAEWAIQLPGGPRSVRWSPGDAERWAIWREAALAVLFIPLWTNFAALRVRNNPSLRNHRRYRVWAGLAKAVGDVVDSAPLEWPGIEQARRRLGEQHRSYLAEHGDSYIQLLEEFETEWNRRVKAELFA